MLHMNRKKNLVLKMVIHQNDCLLIIKMQFSTNFTVAYNASRFVKSEIISHYNLGATTSQVSADLLADVSIFHSNRT